MEINGKDCIKVSNLEFWKIIFPFFIFVVYFKGNFDLISYLIFSLFSVFVASPFDIKLTNKKLGKIN